MYKSLWVAVSLLAVSPLASADIYKCVDDKGALVKYQNFPCEIDSIGSSATASPPTPRVAKSIKIDWNDVKALAELREWRLKTRPDRPTGKLWFESDTPDTDFPRPMDNIQTRFHKMQEQEDLRNAGKSDDQTVDDLK